jgi:flagellar biosynthesis protein FliP
MKSRYVTRLKMTPPPRAAAQSSRHTPCALAWSRQTFHPNIQLHRRLPSNRQSSPQRRYGTRSVPATLASFRPARRITKKARVIIGVLFILLVCPTTAAFSQQRPNSPARVELPSMLSGGPSAWTSPEGLTSSLQIMLTLTVLSMAPAVLLMTTSFVRIIVVLSLLRQALGTQQLPPSQVITSIALFLTLAIMSPVWKQAYDEGIRPYTDKEIGMDEAWIATMRPVRQFMSAQIERTGNSDDVWLFLQYTPDAVTPQSYDDVPLTALLPAFMLSELKTSFLIGFQIYLPFLILDMVISSVMISMGMMMLPPVLISLPFKLLLFVLADGWHLVIGMLIDSFG